MQRILIPVSSDGPNPNVGEQTVLTLAGIITLVQFCVVVTPDTIAQAADGRMDIQVAVQPNFVDRQTPSGLIPQEIAQISIGVANDPTATQARLAIGCEPSIVVPASYSVFPGTQIFVNTRGVANCLCQGFIVLFVT